MSNGKRDGYVKEEMKFWKIFALLAALFNATIGWITKISFNTGLTPSQIAFYKCLIAFLLISVIKFKELPTYFHNRKKEWLKISFCALSGIFILYLFETIAYTSTDIPLIAFILLGTSTISTIILSRFLIGEHLSKLQLLGFALALIGLFLMIEPKDENTLSFVGSGSAIIAGISYSLFLTGTKKLKIETAGIDFLWWLIGIGCLLLSIPFSLYHPTLPQINSLLSLILLAIIPTIGGFYFTNKALSQGEASGVQVFELSEPVFATFISLILLGERLFLKEIMGGILIIFSIYLFGKKKIQ